MATSRASFSGNKARDTEFTKMEAVARKLDSLHKDLESALSRVEAAERETQVRACLGRPAVLACSTVFFFSLFFLACCDDDELCCWTPLSRVRNRVES